MKRTEKSKKKIAVVFGTRPDAIKMAPVIKELKRYSELFDVITINSSQHMEICKQALRFFKIKPDFDLNIMFPGQTLFDINAIILDRLKRVLELITPDLVLIHGDTPTAFAGALAAFYMKIPIGHIEAGLRTYNKYHPFPEEINRQLIDVVTDFYFVPTKLNKQNLIREGKSRKNILITGNTVVDALKLIAAKDYPFENRRLNKINFNKKVILLTCHRRESWGKPMKEIFLGVKKAVDEVLESEVIFPVHPNPLVKEVAKEVFSKHPRIHLFYNSLYYRDIILILKKCYFAATDSGGIQEEAISLGKPALILRKVTERKEGVSTGGLRVAGIDFDRVYKETLKLLVDEKLYCKMRQAKNPYGDGKASKRIVNFIKKKLF